MWWMRDNLINSNANNTNKPELSAPRGIMTSANFFVCNEIGNWIAMLVCSG